MRRYLQDVTLSARITKDQLYPQKEAPTQRLKIAPKQRKMADDFPSSTIG